MRTAPPAEEVPLWGTRLATSLRAMFVVHIFFADTRRALKLFGDDESLRQSLKPKLAMRRGDGEDVGIVVSRRAKQEYSMSTSALLYVLVKAELATAELVAEELGTAELVTEELALAELATTALLLLAWAALPRATQVRAKAKQAVSVLRTRP